MRVLLRLLLGFALTTIGPARALSQPAPLADKVPPVKDSGKDPAKDPAKDSDTENDADTGSVEDSRLEKGTLIIKVKSRAGAPIDDAKVTIDARSMGELEDSELTLTNIPEGSHTVAIEARGYLRFEQVVAIRNGEQARLDAQLDTVPPPRHAPVWKWSLGASVAVLVTGLGYGYYAHDKMTTNVDAVRVTPAQNPDGSGPYSVSFPVQQAACGKTAAEIELENRSIVLNPARFDRACTWQSRIYVGYGIAGAGLIGAFVSVFILRRESVVQGPLPVTLRSKQHDVAIVPTVTPDGAGASLSLTW